jgi:hypothetical protein
MIALSILHLFFTFLADVSFVYYKEKRYIRISSSDPSINIIFETPIRALK